MLYPSGLRAKAALLENLPSTGAPGKNMQLCGQFLTPPGWPGRCTFQCVGDKGTVTWTGLVLDNPDDIRLPKSTEHEYFRSLWDPLQEADPAMDRWLREVYSHMRRCYAVPFDAFSDLVGPRYKPSLSRTGEAHVSYPLNHFWDVVYGVHWCQDDERFCEGYRNLMLSYHAQRRERLHARMAELCTPDSHRAVTYVRTFLPGHHPRMDLIKAGEVQSEEDARERKEKTNAVRP